MGGGFKVADVFPAEEEVADGVVGVSRVQEGPVLAALRGRPTPGRPLEGLCCACAAINSCSGRSATAHAPTWSASVETLISTPSLAYRSLCRFSG